MWPTPANINSAINKGKSFTMTPFSIGESDNNKITTGNKLLETTL